LAKKYKYFVTDGAFVWGYNNLKEARKFAKHLAKTNQLLDVRIVNPKMRTIEEYEWSKKSGRVICRYRRKRW